MARTESLEEQTKKAFQEDPRLAIFAGEGAANADLEMLALAKAKTNEGEDPRKIWRDTGWWKAKDGKWRFEIDDSAANIVDGQIVHAELEKAYPGVFDEIKVTVGPLEGGLLGSWNSSTKELQISSSLSLKDQLDTALHELQHYVQDKEGFESGGNPIQMVAFQPFSLESALQRKLFFDKFYGKSPVENFVSFGAKSKEDIAKEIEKRTDYIVPNYLVVEDIFDQETLLNDFFTKATKKQAEELVGRQINDESWSRVVAARTDANYKNAFGQFLLEFYKEKYPEELSKFEKISDILHYDLPKLGYSEGFDKYESVFGEAEARGVPVRKDMTPSQRRMSFPEDTYLLPEVGVGYEDTWTRPQFEPAFAEGGTVMPNTETQMNRLMQEGGIADDGMRRDPVSGNEIPPGSMATEVRDDIPAQLSEGEYIVPADVLRYYGVAFFEQLRAKAKRGLAEMEQGGRIGGEPVEMEDDDDLPFDISELQTSGDDTDMQMAAMGMAAGGIVKMQGGGVAATTTATKTFDPSMYQTPGGSLFNATSGTQQQKVEYRVYQNAQGQTMSILFINGVAQQPIPEGFFPQGEGPKVEEPAPTDRGDRDEPPPTPQKSFNEYTVEDWISYKPSSGVGNTLGQIAGGMIGGALLGPAGALLGAKGMQEATARNTISGYNALNDFVGNMDVNDPRYRELADKRNGMYEDLNAAQNKEPGFFTKIINDIFGTPELAKPKGGGGRASGGGGTAGGGGGTATAKDSDSGIDIRPETIRKAAEATGAGAKTRVTQDQKLGAGAREGTTTTTRPAPTSTAAAARSYRESADEQYGALAKGGLMMKKPQPKKPTQKRKIKTVST